VATHFADRLIEAIQAKNAPVCIGIDPTYDRLPAEITDQKELNDATDSEAALDAAIEFSRRVIKIVAPIVPAVKINIAFFERYYWEGIEGYFELIQEAKEAGLIVIGDCKRGDIGSTAEMYAKSMLADPDFFNLDDMMGPDAATIASYFGLDGVKPFADVANAQGKGLFALVRTSNPSAAELQNAKLESGDTVAECVAKQVAAWAAENGTTGEKGYSNIGAVVAATDPEAGAKLRDLMPQSIFLVPGFGAQGGTGADVKACFKPDGTGAIVNASRSVIYAYEDTRYIERFTSEWDKCIEQSCKDFVAEVNKAISS
jgi:orotidine-5'-phosphate decarboxylase